MVLVEVLVRALSAVERRHGVCGCWGCCLNLFVGGIFVGVGHFGGFAEGSCAAAVPEADEEGGYCGGKDVAVRKLLACVTGMEVTGIAVAYP